MAVNRESKIMQDILSELQAHSKLSFSSRMGFFGGKKAEDVQKELQERAEELYDILHGAEGYGQFFQGLSPALQKKAQEEIGDGADLKSLYLKSPKALRGSIDTFSNNLENGSDFSNRTNNLKYKFWDKPLATANRFLGPLSFRKQAIQEILNGPKTGAQKEIKRTLGLQKIARVAFGVAALAGVILSGGTLLGFAAAAIPAFGASKLLDFVVVNPSLNKASQAKFEQIRDDFMENNARYRLGTTEETAKNIREAEVAFTLDGIRWSDLSANGTGRGIHLETGDVRLPDDLHMKYSGMFEVKLTGQTLSIVPTKDFDLRYGSENQDKKNQALITAVQEIANGLDVKGVELDDNSNVGRNFKILSKGEESPISAANWVEHVEELQKGIQAQKAAEEQAAATAALNTKIAEKLTNRKFMDTAITAALSASIGKPVDAQQYETLIKAQLATALKIDENDLKEVKVNPSLQKHFSDYYGRVVENDESPMFPAAEAAAAIVGLPENSGKEKFVSKFVEVTRNPQNIPELACMAAVVGTGLNQEKIGELQTVINAVKEQQPNAELTDAIKTTANSVAQAMNISQDDLIAEIRKGLNPTSASSEETTKDTVSFFEQIRGRARA